MAKEVIVTADTIKKRKKAFLKTKVVIGLLILVFLLIFTILGIVFNVNKFTITLDNKLQDEKGIILYPSLLVVYISSLFKSLNLILVLLSLSIFLVILIPLNNPTVVL